mmetsp:Transcript_100321/g.178352  ORF Transcript_100321/g.178352 Transcript_100321/m.178352 type:complete len:112 (+) Transcript_100321:57-392(+)
MVFAAVLSSRPVSRRLLCGSTGLHRHAWRTARRTYQSDAEGASTASSIGKAAGVAVAVSLLLAFHSTIISQREQKEAFQKQRIEELQAEVSQLKAQLKEAERSHFLGKSRR